MLIGLALGLFDSLNGARVTVQSIDVVALVTAIFTGVGTLMSALAASYALVSAARSKRAEISSTANRATLSEMKETVTVVQDTVVAAKEKVDLLEKNTNSITTQLKLKAREEGVVEGELKGVRAGEEAARTLAQGQREGRENERAAAAAASNKQSEQRAPVRAGDAPVPVVDDAAAAIAKQTADATVSLADSAAKTVDATEKRATAPGRKEKT